MRALVDVVIAITLLEAAALCLRHRLTGRGLAPSRLLPNLAAGLCLAVALRLALSGAAGFWIAACLAGSGLAHILDLRGR